MKVLFGEDLGAVDETCVEICRENDSRDEGIVVTEISEERRESADPEEIRVCSVETIIRIWRHLRGDLWETPTGYSLLSLR